MMPSKNSLSGYHGTYSRRLSSYDFLLRAIGRAAIGRAAVDREASILFVRQQEDERRFYERLEREQGVIFR